VLRRPLRPIALQLALLRLIPMSRQPSQDLSRRIHLMPTRKKFRLDAPRVIPPPATPPLATLLPATPRDSAARPAARPRNRPSSVVAAKPRSRSPITRSAIACRSPHFPAFVHSSAAGKPTTISKPGKASSTLLSFRRPHRSRIAS
jgi:hypothetical protein